MNDEQQRAAPPLVTDGEKVAIRDEDGSVSMVHRSDLDAAIGEGARPATEHEYNEAKLGKAGEVASGAIGVGQGLSFGYAAPAAIKGAEALGADETADDIRRGIKIAKETSPNAYLGGEVGGALLPMAFGAPPGEAGAALAEGAGARALQRGVAAAPRAFGEGAAISIGQQATEDTLDNKDFAASAYGASAFKGGLIGLFLGAGTAVGLGHVADKVPGFFGRASEGATEVTDRAVAGESVAAREPGRVSIDPDAGLYGKPEKVELPFTFGGKRHGVTIDSGALDGEFASGVAGGSPIRARAYADAAIPEPSSAAAKDFYLRGHDITGPSEAPEPFFRVGKMPRTRGDDDVLFGDATAPVFSKKPVVERGMVPETERAPLDIRFGVDPNAGLGEEAGAARDVFGITRAKKAPRDVLLGDVEPGTIAGRDGIRIAQPTEAAVEQQAALSGQRGAKEWLEAQSNKFAFKATGANGPDVRRLGETVDEQQAAMDRIGGRIRSYKLADGTPVIGPTTSQAEIAKNVTEAANEVGKELGQLRSKLDTAVARPDMNSIVERFESEVGRPASKMPLGEADVAAARAYLEDMVAKGGERPKFDTLYNYRRRLDDKLRKEYLRMPGTPSAPGADAMHALRGIIEDEFTQAGERAAGEIGGSFASKYKLTKELYADLATARKMATAASGRNGGANLLSLTDVIAGFSTGGVGGVAAVAGNQVRRKFGDQIASHVLGQASKLIAVESAASKMDAALNKGTKAFIEGGAPGTIRPPKKVTAAEVRSLRESVRTPELIQKHIQEAIGDMPQYAPKQASSIASGITRVAMYLRDALPKEPAPTGLMFTRKQRPLSDTELQKAGQVIETVEDPTVVVDRLLEGRLTRAHIDTLRIAHPEVYARTQQYITEHGTELRRELPVQQQVALSLFFGQAVTESMLPANIRALQASLTEDETARSKKTGPNGGGAAPAAAGAPISLKKPGGTVATPNDDIERGDS